MAETTRSARMEATTTTPAATTDRHRDDERRRIAGTIGLVSGIGLAIVLGTHPPGSTALYDDGPAFVEHISAWWLTIHLTAAVLFVPVPFIASTWAARTSTSWGDAWGRMLGGAATFGTALAILHLVGIDTVSFAFFADTLASGAEGAEVGADLLLRLHAASLTAWVVALFLAVQALAAAMAWAEGDRGWRFLVPAAGAVFAIASLATTLAARQYTTLSEMVLFRASATLFILWLIAASWEMRKTPIVVD